MEAVEYYRKLFNYDHWANREVLRALKACNEPSEAPARGALKRLAHVVGAELLWLTRLSIPAEAVPVWPEMGFDQCGRLIDTLANVWDGFLNGLAPGGLDKTIAYRNSKGESWQSRVEDVLTHVIMHSAYHRGQIALEMRSAGLEPAYTDFIQAVRAGAVE
jgi:uncharacterized damage-inducible protein DinB